MTTPLDPELTPLAAAAPGPLRAADPADRSVGDDPPKPQPTTPVNRGLKVHSPAPPQGPPGR